MKINEFIKAIGQASSTQVFKNVLETKQYLPFVEKKALAETIVEKCIVEEDGFIKIDEINKYLIFTIEVIQAYTNLEFSTNLMEAMSEYDELCTRSLLNSIIATFEGEYKIILELSRMAADYALKDNEINAQIARFLNRLGDNLDTITASLKGKVDGFDVEGLKDFYIENADQLKNFAQLFNK